MRTQAHTLAWRRSAAVALLAAAPAAGQVGPHLGYVYPAGGQQGAVLHVIIGGQQVRAASRVYISGEGVRAQIVRPVPLLRKFEREQLPEMRKRLLALREDAHADAAHIEPVARAAPKAAPSPPAVAPKAGATGQAAAKPAGRPNAPAEIDADALSLRELEAYLAIVRTADKRQINAQIADGVLVEISIDPKAAAGDREIRLAGPGGLSNPLRFQVGCLPEVCEQEPMGRPAGRSALSLTLPCTVNGQIMPGDVDLFRFQARRGQHLVIDVGARRLIPYMADAVPGWFQAIATLRDDRGREVAWADDGRVGPDPTLLFLVPADGEYELAIQDALYRGREDFVYRVSIGELPFVRQIFPLGAQSGSEVTAALSGWNLVRTRAPLDTSSAPGVVAGMREQRGKRLSNEVVYAVDDLPECAEPTAQAAAAGPAAMTLPCIVNGRIGKPDEVDAYGVELSAGQELVAEVTARRLNSPLDSRLSIADAAGAVLAANDDMEAPGTGLLTHNADSYLRFRAPAAGIYTVRLTDSTGHGGEEYGYRLRLSEPRPDFELLVTPSSINIGAGRFALVTAHVLRRDGFDGDVEITLAEGPSGLALQGARIPRGRDAVRFTLSASGQPSPEPVAITFRGRAQAGERSLSHAAIPAEDMMQAFSYRHLVPSQELLAAVLGSRAGAPGAAWAGAARIPAGGTVEVRLDAPGRALLRDADLALSDAPEGVTLEQVKDAPSGVAIVLRADAKSAPVGLRDNLIVQVLQRAPRPAAGAAPARQARASLGFLPALPIEVVPP